MPNQFFSPDGDLENYFVTEYWIIDQYIGDRLYIWGRGTSGTLGINATTGRLTPVTTFPGGTNWKQVSTGNNYTAAVKTDGTLWVWGNNASGQLGINNTTTRSTPVTTFAGGNNWKQVSCFEAHTSAIKTDGTLWIWGAGTAGQLGNNVAGVSRSTPVTTFAGGNNWNQVSVGLDHTSAIKTDGTLWVWGSGVNGTLGTNNTTDRSTPVTTFAGGNNWKQVFDSSRLKAAIKKDGTLWTWGSATLGRLGTNDSTNRSTPVTTFAGGTDWKQVSCGINHFSAIKEDGTLWGSGNINALAINQTTGNRSTPVTTFAGGTNWKQVDSGLAGSFAVKTDGTLWGWGGNVYNQLGTNDGTTRFTPITTFAGGTNWKQVSTSPQGHTVVVQSGIDETLSL